MAFYHGDSCIPGLGGVAADSQKLQAFPYGVGGLGSGGDTTVRFRGQTRVFIC